MSKTQVTAQNRGPGHTHREGYLTQLGSPANAYACGCVLANADNRLLYLIPTPIHNQPIAHLRGQHPMTASEPPAKWGADIRGVDDVVCRVEEGRAAAACRRIGNQGKEEWNSKMADSKAHQVPEQQNRRQRRCCNNNSSNNNRRLVTLAVCWGVVIYLVFSLVLTLQHTAVHSLRQHKAVHSLKQTCIVYTYTPCTLYSVYICPWHPRQHCHLTAVILAP